MHHGAGLRALLAAEGVGESERDERIARLAVDPLDRNRFSSADLALIDYADKLTRTPGAITSADIEPLRETGLDDRAIHDLSAIVAYFAFVNRIADGLGVELEAGRGTDPATESDAL